MELGTAGNIKIKHAWVFHDDIFILLSHEKLLYTSVEVCIGLLHTADSQAQALISSYRVFIIVSMTLSLIMAGR